jgi:hypothetical protein
MARDAKNLSIRHLHAAVKAALQAAQTKHPGAKIGSIDPTDPTPTIPITYRPHWILGLPPFPWRELGGIEQGIQFGETFSRNLASNPALAPLAIDGKLESTAIISGDSISIGVVGGNVSLTE